jgi:hypothetical protein
MKPASVSIEDNAAFWRRMYEEARHRVLVECLTAHAGWTKEQMLHKAKKLTESWIETE